MRKAATRYTKPKKEGGAYEEGTTAARKVANEKKETVLPGIHDKATPTRSKMFMQDYSGLAGRDYVPVPGIYGLG
jgi:hypothetical protein